MTPNPGRKYGIDYAALNERLARLLALDPNSPPYQCEEIEFFEALYPICLALAHGRETQAEDARTELLMRLRKRTLTFFSPTIFHHCLSEAGRLAFKGLPPRPKEEETPIRVTCGDEALLGAVPARGGVLETLIDEEEATRQEAICREWRADLARFRETLNENLGALYDFLWSADLSHGWKSEFAEARGAANSNVTRWLGQLDRAFETHRGGATQVPSVVGLVRFLRGAPPASERLRRREPS